MEKKYKILLAGGLLFLAWYLNFSKQGKSIAANIAGGIMNATRGERNNNPGNIVNTGTPWQGMAANQQDSRFITFADPVYGIRALAKTLLTYYNSYGLNNVSAIISRWAPPSENDTISYINSVSQSMGVSPTQTINLTNPVTLNSLTSAIIKHENGRISYDVATIQNGVNLALA